MSGAHPFSINTQLNRNNEGFVSQRTFFRYNDAMHLPLDTVHVWRLDMSLPQTKVEALRETLTSDERSRADRYHFQRDRNRFIVARGVLRSMLGRYLGIKPENLRFDYTKYGKPVLADPSLSKEWHFNVSHAGSQALYGIARHRRIGVDIEFMRNMTDHLEIAE